MNKQPLSLEESLNALYQKVEPDPDFTSQLEKKLLAFEFKPEERPQLSRYLIQVIPVVGWIAAGVILFMVLIWAINDLVVRPVPGSIQTKTASPTSPQASPTPFSKTQEPTTTRTPVLYTVKFGDTLLSIADETDMSVEIIAALNNVDAGSELTPGAVLVVGFATPVQTPSRELMAIDPLSSASSSEEIRRCLQSSASTWNTLWANALLTTDSKGEEHIEREQVWLQDGANRWLTGVFGAKPSLLWIEKEGKSALVDLQSGEIQQVELSSSIPSQLENLIFPTRFASRGGKFRPFKVETIAERETVAVEWIDNEKRLNDRFWIDSEHCVILKWDHLPREYADASGKIVPAEVTITSIVFDEQFPPSLFDLAGTYPQDFAVDFETP